MPIYRPRMHVRMLVPLDDGVAHSEHRVLLTPRLRSATLTRNDHNHADELEFECAWSDLGIDPRMARGRVFKVSDLRIHLAAAGDGGEFSIEVGYLNKIELGGR